MRVTVVGAGIMGLSTAWALARRGVEVTVLDQGSIPNPLGSSCDRHRLIRYPYGSARGYTRRVEEAYLAWDLLWADLGQSYYRPTGTLALEGASPGWTTASRDILASLGIPHAVLSPGELARRFPYLCCDDVEWALHLDSGGALLARPIVEALARHLTIRGVTLRSHARVAAIETTQASVQLEDGDRIGADALVVAAGPWTPELVTAPLLPIRPSRQVVVYVQPPADRAEAWAGAPMILDVGSADGFYCVPDIDGHGLKVGDHNFSLLGHPDEDREPSNEEAQAVFRLCRNRLVDFEHYRLAKAITCFYSVEPEERFIVEQRDRAWILAGFSGHGFKFAAAVGLAAAQGVQGLADSQSLAAWAAGDPDAPAQVSG